MSQTELICWGSWFGVLSLAAFVIYGIDKRRAQLERDRIPERTLHLLSLAGGWPGAVLGQKVFRHKTVKKKFRLVFWLTVFGNLVAAVILFAAFKQFAQWFS